jgi:hypothetical protein
MAATKVATTTTVEYQFTLPTTIKDLREFINEVHNFSDNAKVEFKVYEPDYDNRISTGPTSVKITLTQNGPLSNFPRIIVGQGTFEK